MNFVPDDRVVLERNESYWGVKPAVKTLVLRFIVDESTRQLGLLSNEIWFLAGDRDTEATWYAKRGAVAAIYSASGEVLISGSFCGGYYTGGGNSSVGKNIRSLLATGSRPTYCSDSSEVLSETSQLRCRASSRGLT